MTYYKHEYQNDFSTIFMSNSSIILRPHTHNGNYTSLARWRHGVLKISIRHPTHKNESRLPRKPRLRPRSNIATHTSFPPYHALYPQIYLLAAASVREICRHRVPNSLRGRDSDWVCRVGCRVYTRANGYTRRRDGGLAMGCGQDRI
jgi:hypothetical protein